MKEKTEENVGIDNVQNSEMTLQQWNESLIIFVFTERSLL